MEKIISLIKTDLNVSFGLSALKYKFQNKKDRWQSIILFIVLLSLLPTYIMIVKGLSELYLAYVQIGQKSAFLLNGFVYSQLIVFIFGIIFILSKYYFSNDLDILVPLPIKSRDIIAAKFITSMVNEYMTSLPIILPFIFIYGIKGNEGILYWLYSILLVLFVPVIPLALASIIVMIFMKYTNIRGRKDLLRGIGYVFLLVAMLAFQFKMQSIAQKSVLEGNDFFFNIAKDSNILVRKMGKAFPPGMWGSLALGENSSITGLLNLILFIGLSILVFLIMLELSEKLFFKGLIGNMEVSHSRHKKISIKDYSKVSPGFIAIALKEIKMLFRTPVYLMNSVMGVVIVPIIFLMSYYMNGGTFAGRTDSFFQGHIVSLIGSAVVVLLSGLNSVCSTTFSREGKNFWIQRVLPIKVQDQIIGRILSSLFIQLIGIIALLFSLYLVIELRIENIIWITILGLLGSIVMSEIGMVVDIFRPLLDWDNPQKAMKQNLNVLITMGLSILYLLGLVYLVKELIIRDVSLYIIYGIPILIFSISAYILYILLKKIIYKQMQLIE